MPLITTITPSWSAAVTLTTAEVWQARSRVFVTTEASPTQWSGLEMLPGDAIAFEAGEVVRHRSPETGAQIFRMPVL